MCTVIKSPSVKDINASLLNQLFNPNVGEPTPKTLDNMQNQFIHNASSIEYMLVGGQHGLDGLSEFPQVYILRTGHNLIRSLKPGDVPS